MVQANSLKGFAIIICGPTGTGKTALAVELAKRLNTEIVSADSMAIYKQLDIGTAKPDSLERAAACHHMIDVVEKEKDFSVSEYEKMALPIVMQILESGKIPIICGGTGYYINSLLYPLSYGNIAKNEKIRAELEKLLAEQGAEGLYSRLMEIDIETAQILHKNDTKRVMRALEIFYGTGRKKSEIKDEMISRFPYYAFSYDYSREKLYARLDERVDKMFEKGLLNEVKGLIDDGLNEACQSMQAIGYKEIVQGLKESLPLEQIIEAIKKNTRNYAKRQITFFKKTKGLIYLPELSPERSADEVLKIIYEHQAN